MNFALFYFFIKTVSDVRLGGLDYLSRSDSKVAELDKGSNFF
jgi:hypothetical protein